MKLKSPVEVSVTGEKFVLALYGGQRLATLDEYMYSAYNRNIAIKSIGATFTLAQQLDSILCGHIYKYHNGWEEIIHQLSGDGSTTITH